MQGVIPWCCTHAAMEHPTTHQWGLFCVDLISSWPFASTSHIHFTSNWSCSVANHHPVARPSQQTIFQMPAETAMTQKCDIPTSPSKAPCARFRTDLNPPAKRQSRNGADEWLRWLHVNEITCIREAEHFRVLHPCYFNARHVVVRAIAHFIACHK